LAEDSGERPGIDGEDLDDEAEDDKEDFVMSAMACLRRKR
jgi:hypothetical protein